MHAYKTTHTTTRHTFFNHPMGFTSVSPDLCRQDSNKMITEKATKDVDAFTPTPMRTGLVVWGEAMALGGKEKLMVGRKFGHRNEGADGSWGS